MPTIKSEITAYLDNGFNSCHVYKGDDCEVPQRLMKQYEVAKAQASIDAVNSRKDVEAKTDDQIEVLAAFLEDNKDNDELKNKDGTWSKRALNQELGFLPSDDELEAAAPTEKKADAKADAKK